MFDEHLRLHLRDGEHLKHFALQQFLSAIRTGRLIAFVGSYATEDLGYPKWDEFLEKYSKLFGSKGPAGMDWRSLARLEVNRRNIPSTTLIDLFVEKHTAKMDRGALDRYISVRRGKLLSKNFFGLDGGDGGLIYRSTPYEIVESLGIDRIITINYDLEFEWQFMVSKEESALVGDKTRAEFFHGLIQSGRIKRDYDTRALSRRLPSGRTTHSDVFDRGRTDRLIEFAVGAPDHNGHVLHLHGRATKGDEDRLIVALGDYQQQYRRSDIAKVPFEHALKLLYAGNPVIFIGNGMAEPEVTDTLENFVSDDPRRRLAPAFVLWSPKVTEKDPKAIAMGPEDELRRLEWYRRFGILTIYDCELAWGNTEHDFDCAKAVEETGYRDQPRRVAYAVRTLGAYARDNLAAFQWRRRNLRAAQSRFPTSNARSSRPPCRFDVWRCRPLIKNENMLSDIFRAGSAKSLSDAPDKRFFETLFRGPPVKAIIDRPGFGHGYLAKVIAKAFSDEIPKLNIRTAASLVNAGFICEIDSTLSLISGLFDNQTAFGRQLDEPDDSRPDRAMSRQAAFLRYEEMLIEQMKEGELDRHLLVVINGMDRFFDTSGYPLSNELDDMMRRIAQTYRRAHGPQGHSTTIHDWVKQTNTVNPFTVILLGSARVQRYLDGLGWLRESDENVDSHRRADYVVLGTADHEPGRALLDEVVKRNEALWKKSRKASPFKKPSTTPHSNYLILLQERMQDVQLSTARLALMERSRSRSIGDLRHNVLSAYLRSDTLAEKFSLTGESPDLCLDILSALAFFGQPIDRCVISVLPRVQRRLRGCIDAIEQIDAAIEALADLGLILVFDPFPDSPAGWYRVGIHRTVMAELRNRYGVPISDAKLSAGFNLSLFASQLIDDYAPKPDVHRELGELVDQLIETCTRSNASGAEPGAYLRAAMLLMRSYFTTSALLMLEPPVQPAPDYKAPLTDHAERLERLIKSAERLAVARSKIRDVNGAEAFFPDDLVWLHNELGVVKLVQGDLYKARFAFEQAESINQTHVEYGDELQNWRRIQLNQLQLDIERGKINRAESRILELERAVNNHVNTCRLDAVASNSPSAEAMGESIAGQRSATQASFSRADNAVEQIIECYGSRAHERTRMVDAEFPADAVLTVGLIVGYRGLCAYLRGNFKSALRQLNVAVEVLRNIGEQRACAIFLRHSVSLLSSMGLYNDARENLRIGLAAADSVRQMDIAFLFRVERISSGLGEFTEGQPLVPLQQIIAALHYSVGADMFRVRIEARIAFSEIRFATGDYDAALEHASDALSVATRFGFSLRKISLRILIGRILIRRGDPKSGNALLREAMINADRVGYQRAVELAQHVKFADTKTQQS